MIGSAVVLAGKGEQQVIRMTMTPTIVDEEVSMNSKAFLTCT